MIFKELIFVFSIGVYLIGGEVNKSEGIHEPAVGFGTYPLKEDTCFKAVRKACELGYRIIDTATFYENFRPIGEALKASGIERKDLTIISKVWPNAQTAEGVEKDLKRTLKELQISYLDCYLVHWPNSQIPIEETLGAMQRLKEEGLIRHIGLSNVTINHLKRARETNVKISWIQVEMHPLFYDPELIQFCQENEIGIQAWGPLARGALVQDPLLTRIGKKYNKSAAQVALKWIVQHKCLPLPGSSNPHHIKQNLEMADFALSSEEMREIDQRAARGQRQRVTKEYGLGFTDEFDFSYEECWPKTNH